ncbi:MAG TPA: HAD-IA family hydrolase [bacterium]|nr:HAD-IA family hydrolase [bacterium]
MVVRTVTFDVYSAMFDTVAGLTRAVGAFFERRGLAADAAAAARAWRRAQMDYLLLANSLDREPASNRAAIEASARHVLRGYAPPIDDGEMRTLVEAWERLPAWPEAAEVLAEVRRRPLVLGVLSNGDSGMLEALMRTFPVRFDRIVSVEGGKFKPHPSVYRKALAQMEARPEELLHVAGSASDAAGATAAGLRTIWINRAGDAVLDPRFTPAHQSPDLRGVFALL